MDKPFVSVIIPVYNDSARLQKTLQALYLQTYPYARYEVIVVDNASDNSEEVPAVVRRFPNAIALYEAKRGSYAARNRGIATARGEIIAFTDSDCIPHTDWILAGVRSLLDNPKAGLIAGHIEFFFAGHSPTVGEYVDSIFHLRQEHYSRVQHFGATGNVFTWRSVFDHVGEFNDQLYSMGDKEWGQRVWAAGYEVVYSPKVIVRHPARNTQELLAKTRRCAQGNASIDVEGFTWGKLWSHIKPIDPGEYLKAFEDDNLPTLRDKLAFILLINRLKYTIALQMLACWRNRKTANPFPMPTSATSSSAGNSSSQSLTVSRSGSRP